MVKKFYTAKYDRVFKTILCDEENKSLLQEFLSRVFHKKVEVVEFLRNELPVLTVEEKVKTVDVLVKVDGEYIHIELNSSYNNYLHVRNFVYFSTLYSKKVQRGERYDTKTKFIHIDFTFELPKNEIEYEEYYLMNEKQNRYLDNIQFIEYNMDKIMEYWYNQDEEKIKEYRHLIMLDLETDELIKLSEGDDFVKEFKEKITKLNESETFQSAMTYEEDQKLILNTEKRISFEEGIEKGIEEGSLQKSKETATVMLKDGLELEIISKYTNLSIEEIKNLPSYVERS